MTHCLSLVLLCVIGSEVYALDTLVVYVFLKEESVFEVSFFFFATLPLRIPCPYGVLINVQTEKASLCLNLSIPED